MKGPAVFVVVWFLLALTLSVTGWFERFSSAILFAIGALVSVIGFAVLHASSDRFRGFVRGRSLKRLTQAQTLRLFGILALVKAYQDILPPVFAVPVGLIDVAFAISSLFVASRLVGTNLLPSRTFIAWHVLGVVGLAVSATLAILTSTSRFGLVDEGHTSQPMTWFPMSLVPTFIGPFVLICHLFAILVALQSRSRSGVQSATDNRVPEKALRR